MTSPLEQKKARTAGPSIVTANRAFDGAVIYRTAAGNWSMELSDAALVRDPDAARALLAQSVADNVRAIGAYLAPVALADDGTLGPGNLRERIRCSGVTVALWGQTSGPPTERAKDSAKVDLRNSAKAPHYVYL